MRLRSPAIPRTPAPRSGYAGGSGCRRTARGESCAIVIQRIAPQRQLLQIRQRFHALELLLDLSRPHPCLVDAVAYGVELVARFFQHACELAELRLHRAEDLPHLARTLLDRQRA